jgi:hypothetical protein
MPPQVPPAHVQTISVAELQELRSSRAALDPIHRTCISELSELLSLPPKLAASPLVMRQGEEFGNSVMRYLTQRSELAVDSAPLGSEIGAFSYSSTSIRFTTSSPTNVKDLACKIFGLRDSSVLSAEMVTGLLEVNPHANPRLLRELSHLKDSIVRKDLDGGATFEVLAPEMEVIAPKEMQAAVQDLKTTAALALVDELHAAVENLQKSGNSPLLGIPPQDIPPIERLIHMQQILEKSSVLARSSALTHSAPLDAARFLTRATTSVSIVTPSSNEDVAFTFRRYSDFLKHLEENPSKQLSSDELATIKKNVTASLDSLYSTYRDAHLIRAQYLTLNNDLPSILKEYIAASLYEKAHVSLLPGSPSLLENINSDAYGMLLLGYSKLIAPPTEKVFDSTKVLLQQLLPKGAAELVMNDALQVLRGNILAEYPSFSRTKDLSSIQRLSDNLLHSAVSAQGLTVLNGTLQFEGTTTERVIAVQTLLLHTQELCERREFKQLGTIDRALSHLLSPQDDAAADLALRSRVLCTLTPYLLRNSEVRSALTATLAKCEVELPKSGTGDVVTKRLLDRLFSIDSSTFPSKDIDFVQQQFYSTTTASIGVAAHAALSYAVLHSTSEMTKLESFVAIKKIYTSVQSEEQEKLNQLLQQRDSLTTSIALMDKNEAPVTYRTTQGKLLTLDAAITRLSRSIVNNGVETATLALQGRHPQLTTAARDILSGIPKEAVKNGPAEKLLRRFNQQHHSDSEILSALQEFLEQSVRDKPLYTFGLMIAAGLLGAGLTTRRNRGQGFLLASSAAMLGTKVYCMATGASMIAEAFATKLTYATPLTSSLDALYLFTDIAQASLLIAAYRNLNKSATTQNENPRGSVTSVVRNELYQFSQLAISQLDPRSLGFYLIGTPIAVGAHQILTSGLRSEEQFNQFVQLGYEVLPILLAALVYERTKARVEGHTATSTAIDRAEEALPPLPKIGS